MVRGRGGQKPAGFGYSLWCFSSFATASASGPGRKLWCKVSNAPRAVSPRGCAFRRLRLTGAGLGQAGLYLHGNFVKVPALVRQALRDARSQLTQLRGMGGTGHNQQQALVFQLAYLADGASGAGNSAATAY